MTQYDKLDRHNELSCLREGCTTCAIKAQTRRLEEALAKVEAAVKAGFEREAQRYTEQHKSLPGPRCRAIAPNEIASCTRSKGHAGDHVAHTRAGFSIARWPNTDPHNSPRAGKEE